ncbi:Dihydroxy-acid dehydratase [Phytophthora palmivora]|uniref:Dihydroxy-acid dehydratase n=1 Tax=Phytophthora palmivora TaxID=4796 RepID=A0A2P4XM91_9STRA|nr:Dihydroxy-acid dehydratase [Phytophthora palmivora]
MKLPTRANEIGGSSIDSTSLGAIQTSRARVPNIYEPSPEGKSHMESLNMQSGLHVVAEAKITKAYHDNAELGLLSLCFTDVDV